MTSATATKTSSRRAAKPAPPRDGLNPGDYVTNPLKPDWGPGKVVDLKRDVVFVFFRDRPGTEVIRMKERGLVPTEPDADLEALPDFVEKDTGYVLPRASRKKAAAKAVNVDTSDSFAAFVEEKVLPHREAHPDWKRLDGAEKGSNGDVFGMFRYDDVAYRVHADTHFEPLLVGYQAVQDGDEAPFVESPTKTRERLDLKPEIRKQVKGRFKHVYAHGAAKP